ncbi:MAG: hypothetical protein SGILL_003161 [Bacillariaceae sp.]
MPESSAASNNPPKKNGVWKTGANIMASAASNVAKTASQVGVGGGSRRKVDSMTTTVESDSMEHHSFSESSLETKDKTAGNKNVLQKTFKSIKKGAKKVDPRRVASAVKTQIQGDNNNNHYSSSLASQLGTEEAEDAVLSSVGKRSKHTTAGEDGFRPAVEGERPPMSVPSLGTAFARAVASKRHSESKSGGGGRSSPSMKAMVQQVMAAQRLERAVMMHKQASSTANVGGAHRKGNNHRRVRTLLDAIGNEDKEEEPEEAFGGSDLRDFHKVFDADPSSMQDDRPEEIIHNPHSSRRSSEILGDSEPHESLPLLSGDDDSGGQSPTLLDRQWRARQMLVKTKFKRVQEMLNPVQLACDFFHWITHSTLLLAIPLFVIACILFYQCGNPKPPEFLPGEATLSWWFNFVGRQLLIFELARVSQYFMIDFLVLSTRFVSRTLGPWVTIFCIQSKGWPFVLGAWALWDLLLLQGSSKFDYHWLYFTGIRIYSSGNSGSYIISSETYLRVLLAGVLIGVTTTLKRTASTLYFGRRMFDAYKPRLEEILNDIVLVSEIAELSVESYNIAKEIGVEKKAKRYEPPTEIKGPPTPSRTGSKVQWSAIKFEDGEDEPTETESQITDFDGDMSVKSAYYDSNSSRIPLKDLLDRWQEPVSKKDKTFDVTVNDILKFRRALTYMDIDWPFSESFGRAATRNEMILSAEVVYNRLMNLSTEHDILSYSVFQILLLQEDGSEDKDKRKALRNLFRPDGDDNLPMLSFVQACDNVYKKIRYFRASVGNASVIDQVLESIIDVVFYFTLGLLVLSILNLNPWAILVSLSTLLVTASFAVGPSAAKAIEGILLIVGRRPFDIGDRIIIGDSPGSTVPTMSSSCTTLRYAASNEVATVSNGSLASARITNCARSISATVHTLLKFHISCHQGRLIDDFRDAVDKYVQERPNIWDSVIFFRMEEIDPNNEVVTYRLVCRSRYTWQICNRVLQCQADLHKFCIKLTFDMGINYDQPNARSIVYFGGSLVDGGIQDYKANVLQNTNIKNDNDVMTGLVPVIRGASQTSLDADERAPRFVKTAEESRAMEQEHQETNDDEMDARPEEEGERDGMDDNLSAASSESGAADANDAFLKLLQKSNG